LDGYRILHVSDIHFDEKIGRDQVLWDQLHSNVADLILITGDFVTHGSKIDALVRYLENSKARDGIYGILGNHDYTFLTLAQHFRHRILKQDYIQNDWQHLVSALDQIGMKVLINEAVTVKTSTGASLFIEGTDDPVRGNPTIKDKDLQYDSSDLKILMSHSPDILHLDELRKKKFDLLLSGHTHGGQIRIPRIGPLLTGTRWVNRKECYGTYMTSDGMFVNVCSGVGYSLLPIRINCPSELIVIELVKDG